MGRDSEDLTVKINDVEFKFVKTSVFDEMDTSCMGNAYKLYLDHFGRIYSFEEVALTEEDEATDNTVTIAIAEEVISSVAWDSDGLGLSTEDGTIEKIEFAPSCSLQNQIEDIIYANSSQTAKNPIYERVVAYETDSDNRISNLEILEPKVSWMAEYDESAQSIGDVSMDDTTVIINAVEYNEDLWRNSDNLSIISTNYFTSGVAYEVYGIGELNENGNYPCVILLDERIITEE